MRFLAAALLLGWSALAEAEKFEIVPISHATVAVESGAETIVVDPWCKGDFTGVPLADLVLITDIHGDHMDPPCVDKVRKPDAVIFAPAAVAEKVKGVTVIGNGETKHWHDWTIEAIPMYNIVRGPAPGKLYHDKGRGNGYVLTGAGRRLYFSGDTENIPEMRGLKNIDIAFVCMNLPYTMTPEEAAEGVKAMHPKVVYPYHYRNGDGTFSDLKKFQSTLEGTGIEVRVVDWYAKQK